MRRRSITELFCGTTVGLVLLATALAGSAAAQISPGPLSHAHGSLSGPTKCVSCHGVGAGAALKCLDCHREIARRIDARSGYHASLGNGAPDCARCHAEHKGADNPLISLESAKFDHSKTGYALDGKHAGLECRKCHTAQHVREGERGSIKLKNLNRTYLGLPQNCETCHADKHQGQLKGGCAQCHTFAGFKGPGNLKFEHARAKFQLTGKHIDLACQKCHLPQGAENVVKYTGLKFEGCASCHKDPHRATLAGNCEQCHATAAWKQTRVAASGFNHPKAKFELAGKHIEVRCAQCHGGADFKKPVAHKVCADCHKKDIHSGQFKQRADGGECGACHTVNGFKPAKYDVRAHSAAGYALEGRHTEVACAKCHTPAGKETRYRLKHARCLDCHKDSHQGQIAAARDPNRCEGCHTVNGFGRPTFTLARHQETQFPLTGEHRAVACTECHKTAGGGAPGTPGRFRFDDRSCAACHEDPHRAQFKQRMAQRRRDGSAVGCEACHSTKTWKELTKFDHAGTKFTLSGAHRAAPCSGCHKPPNLETTLKHVDFAATPKNCEQCHQEPHDGQFAVRGKPGSPARAAVARDGVEGTACADCHNTNKWKPSLFDHTRRAGFPLAGAHQDVRCTACHKNSRQAQGKLVLVYKPTPSKCVDCHRAVTVAAQQPK